MEKNLYYDVKIQFQDLQQHCQLDSFSHDFYVSIKLQERVSDSSTKGPAHLARSSVPPYSVPVLPMDDDDGSYKGQYSIDLGIMHIIVYV